MPEGNQDQRGVAVAVAPASLGGFDQLLDFGRRQVFTGPQLGIWHPGRHNCPIYIAGLNQPQSRIHGHFLRYCRSNLPDKAPSSVSLHLTKW